MGIKVSQMPSTNTLTDNDLVMVVQDNENKKINKKDLQNNLTDPDLTKRVEELEKENAYLNNLAEQAFDKKEVEGEELSIDNTIEAKMNVSLYGNTKQETTKGKNLLPNNATNQTINGVVVIKNEDGSIIVKGTATAVTDIYILGNATTYKKINGYGNLKLNGCNGGSSSTYMLYCVQNKNETLSYYQNYKDDINIASTEEDTFRVFIRVLTNATIDTTIYPMIRLATITDSSYEKFTNGASPNPDYPQEIQKVTGNNSVSITGKNLFNGIFELGGYQTSDGTKGSSNDRIRTPGFIKVNPNQTYSLSFENAGSVYVLEYDKNKAYLKYTLAIYHVLSGNFTTDVKTEYITFYYIPYQHELSLNEKCQLEVGSTATEYEPYQNTKYPISLGNIELCKIGDYQDYFYKNNNKWYKREVIGSVTLDGSENWQKFVKTGVTRYFQNTTPQSIKYTNRVTNNLLLVCSNYFLGITQNASDNNGIGIAPYNSAGCLLNLSVDTSFDTVEKLKTFIANKKPIYKYVKAESTDIEITDTTLIEQLEALKTAMSYTEQTNISQINDDIPFILKVTALTSYNSRIVALENAILNANRSAQTENTRKSNEVIEETKKEFVDE